MKPRSRARSSAATNWLLWVSAWRINRSTSLSPYRSRHCARLGDARANTRQHVVNATNDLSKRLRIIVLPPFFKRPVNRQAPGQTYSRFWGKSSCFSNYSNQPRAYCMQSIHHLPKVDSMCDDSNRRGPTRCRASSRVTNDSYSSLQRDRLGSRLKYEVERRLSSAAESREPTGGDDLAKSRLSRLSPQPQTNFLR